MEAGNQPNPHTYALQQLKAEGRAPRANGQQWPLAFREPKTDCTSMGS